jgi:hypothetical protein
MKKFLLHTAENISLETYSIYIYIFHLFSNLIKLSFADFALFHVLDAVLAEVPDFMKDTPKLSALVEKIRHRPSIDAYLKVK